MLSGFTRDEGKYFVKPSPARKGKRKNIREFNFKILVLKSDEIGNNTF